MRTIKPIILILVLSLLRFSAIAQTEKTTLHHGIELILSSTNLEQGTLNFGNGFISIYRPTFGYKFEYSNSKWVSFHTGFRYSMKGCDHEKQILASGDGFQKFKLIRTHHLDIPLYMGLDLKYFNINAGLLGSYLFYGNKFYTNYLNGEYITQKLELSDESKDPFYNSSIEMFSIGYLFRLDYKIPRIENVKIAIEYNRTLGSIFTNKSYNYRNSSFGIVFNYTI